MRAQLHLVADDGPLRVQRREGDRRVVIGPIAELSASTAPRLRMTRQLVVDDDWSTGRPSVVEVDIGTTPVHAADVLAVLADAGEEIQAVGGRLDIIAN